MLMMFDLVAAVCLKSGTCGDAWVPSVDSARHGPGVGPWLKPLRASRGEAVCDDALRVALMRLSQSLPKELGLKQNLAIRWC